MKVYPGLLFTVWKTGKSENFSDAKSEDPGLKNARLCGKKFMIPKVKRETIH